MISCSNKDTTGPTTPTVTSIDLKWHGAYMYSVTTETGVSVESTIIVDADGISIDETKNGETVSLDLGNEKLKNVSENVYQTEEASDLPYIKFEFANTDTAATLTVTEYVDGQASAPIVHTLQAVIDFKWYGTYSGKIDDPNAGQVTYKIIVYGLGIIVSQSDSKGTQGVAIMNDQITKVSDNTYTFDPSTFEFASDSLKYTSNLHSLTLQKIKTE